MPREDIADEDLLTLSDKQGTLSSIQDGCVNIKLHERVREARSGTPKKRKEGSKPLRTRSSSGVLVFVCEVKGKLMRMLSSLLASLNSSGIREGTESWWIETSIGTLWLGSKSCPSRDSVPTGEEPKAVSRL